MNKIILYLTVFIIFIGLGYAWRFHHEDNLYRLGLESGEEAMIRFLQTCGQQNQTQWYGDLRCVPRTDGRVIITVTK